MRYSLTFLLCACWILAGPAPAAAQVPLADCKTAKWTGPSLGTSEAGMISGAVELECGGTAIFADEITWDQKTLRASGRLLVVQEGLRVSAERLEMDRQTHLGTFYNAIGTARLTERDIEKSMFGTLEPEVMFEAARLEKTGPRTYRLTDGWFSTCVQPNPRWEIRGSTGTVVLDEHVLLRNAVLRVKGVPVIYLPVMYYPLGEGDRATGFLIPTYSSSTIKGSGLSNAFFWAIDRSQDATFYHDWFSKSGQGAGAEYRFVSSPGSQGNATFYMLDESARLAPDGSVERLASRRYDVRGAINQRLGRRFQLVGNGYYFSDAATQQLYQQNVADFSRRDRYFGLTLKGNLPGGLRLSALTERRDAFTGLTTAQRFGRLPQVSLWLSDRPIRRSPVTIGASGEVVNFQTRTDYSQASTERSLWRYDVTPTLRAPLRFRQLPFLSVGTAASWRLTRWTESLDPLTGGLMPVPISRSLFDLRADIVGPVLERVFQTPDNGYAERFKHVIEPRFTIQWLSAFDRFNEVVRHDHVDQQVGGTTTMTYSLTNRLLARVRQAGGTSTVRNILSVSISQSYYSNALAGAFDPQYQSASSSTFSPIQVQASTTPTDRLSGRFQMFIDSDTLAVRSYSASARAHGQLVQLDGGWSLRRYLPDVPGFDNPAGATHFLNATASVRTPGGRYGGTYGFNFDVKQRSFLQQRIVASVNAQCCGVAVDYQVVSLSHLGVGVIQDRRFGISFTLAGIGSFSNPFGSFGDNGGRR